MNFHNFYVKTEVLSLCILFKTHLSSKNQFPAENKHILIIRMTITTELNYYVSFLVKWNPKQMFTHQIHTLIENSPDLDTSLLQLLHFPNSQCLQTPT